MHLCNNKPRRQCNNRPCNNRPLQCNNQPHPFNNKFHPNNRPLLNRQRPLCNLTYRHNRPHRCRNNNPHHKDKYLNNICLPLTGNLAVHPGLNNKTNKGATAPFTKVLLNEQITRGLFGETRKRFFCSYS